ncbi:MAG TPA: aa3-type cytochrome c oxidase subunit IV [Aestuariivirga sp.]|nr:aa3-type cytochrome c oxidase subunit IV [Aestuariivirga sp.]
MAEHMSSDSHASDLDAHRSTYQGFIRGAVALSLISAFVLVALVAFRFGQTLHVALGFLGLLAGIAAVAIDSRLGSRWRLSLGLLLLFGLITAINVS